jgi:hypothetical protein
MSKESEAFAARCYDELKAAQICGQKLTPDEARAVIAKCYESTNKAKRAAFTPPTPEEVTAYSIGIGWPLDGVSWCLGYEKKGWCISGNAKMKSWRSAVEHWKRDGIKTKFTPHVAPRKVAIEMPDGLRDWINEEMPNCPYARGQDREHLPWSEWEETHRKEILRQFNQQRNSE